jgi:hypothetical protein
MTSADALAVHGVAAGMRKKQGRAAEPRRPAPRVGQIRQIRPIGLIGRGGRLAQALQQARVAGSFVPGSHAVARWVGASLHPPYDYWKVPCRGQPSRLS